MISTLARTYLGLSERIGLGALGLLDATTVLVTNQWLATYAARSAHALQAFRSCLGLATGQAVHLDTARVEFFIFMGATWLERGLFQRNIDRTRGFGYQWNFVKRDAYGAHALGQFALGRWNAFAFFIFQIAFFAVATWEAAERAPRLR